LEFIPRKKGTTQREGRSIQTTTSIMLIKDSSKASADKEEGGKFGKEKNGGR